VPSYDVNRPWRKLYGRRWRGARADYLGRHPLCVMCLAAGDVRPATIVDHKRAHRGDAALFWNATNWQALCQPHHDRDKQSEERGPDLCRPDGYPTGGKW
jgi:5-methylcytosine-specific restriction endonuclease McrA